MLVAVEQARSMAIYATSVAEHVDIDVRRRAISAAKVQVDDSLRFVAGNAVQLHGGIGVTEECAIGPYFKRATVIEGGWSWPLNCSICWPHFGHR